MITYFFPTLLSHTRRRWAYAVVEVATITIFALCAPVILWGRSYRLGFLDPGMARITAICFVVVSMALFAIATCLKRIDCGDGNDNDDLPR